MSEDMIELLAVALYNQEYPDASDRNPNWPTWETHPETGRAASLCYEEHSREDFRDQAKAVLAALGIPASTLASLRAGEMVAVRKAELAEAVEAARREGYKAGWNDREGDLLAGIDRACGADAQPRQDEGN